MTDVRRSNEEWSEALRGFCLESPANLSRKSAFSRHDMIGRSGLQVSALLLFSSSSSCTKSFCRLSSNVRRTLSAVRYANITPGGITVVVGAVAGVVAAAVVVAAVVVKVVSWRSSIILATWSRSSWVCHRRAANTAFTAESNKAPPPGD